MKLQKLHLKNIGPFLDDEIEFATFENSQSQVTILTGENGTGKTVILDALRKLLLYHHGVAIRAIGRNDNFSLKLNLNFNNQAITLNAKKSPNSVAEIFEVTKDDKPFRAIYEALVDVNKSKGNLWITNYWTSQNDHKPFHISSLDFIKPEQYLIESLSGIQKNSETTKIVTFFDYYKSSDKTNERKEGEFIFDQLKKIFKISLYNGEFVHVERTNLLPLIRN